MRIEHLHLERYGAFSDRKLSFDPEAVLHIIVGANEAGKTSALSAIGDFIFGFGGRTVYDFKHESKSLRIGGRLRHSDGRTVTARRRKGIKNTLVDHNEEALPDDLFDAFTAGISRDIFMREFGLTAEALRVGGGELLNAGGKLSETLAASSAGMSRLTQLTTQLSGEAEDLFTPRKSASKAFYKAVERRDQADQTLRESIVTREAIKRCSEEFDAASRDLEALNHSHSELGKSLALCQRALRVRQALSLLDGLEIEMSSSSPLVGVSVRQMSDWREALARLGDLNRQMVVLDEATARDASELGALSVDQGLLTEATTLDALRERLGAVRKATDDLPRRRQARDAGIASLEDAARKLALSSYSDILTKLPSAMSLAQARDLIEKRKAAELALVDAGARCDKLEKERDEHAAGDQHDRVMDISKLRQRFEALGDVTLQVERQLRERAALSVETESIAASLAGLTPPLGPLLDLRSLPVPDAPVIESYAQQYASLVNDLKAAEGSLAASAKVIATDEGELVRLSREGATATRDDLLRAREERDQAFTEFKASLSSDPQAREQRLDDLARSWQTIDTVTDRLLMDVQRATRLADIRLRLEINRGAHDEQEASRDGVKGKLKSFEVAWRQLWEPCGVLPDAPQSMLRWREKVVALSGRLNACDEKKIDVGILDAGLAQSKQAILAFLESADRVVDPALPASVLFREAKGRFGELQDAWAEARTRSATKARLDRDLAEVRAARTSARALLAENMSQWAAAMNGLGLGGSTSPVEADAALAVWQSIPLIKNNFERDARSVGSIEDDLGAFNDDVFKIVDRVASQLRSRTAEESLTKILAALEVARRSEEGRQRLEKTASERARMRAALAVAIEAVNATLAEACLFVAASDVATLPVVLDRIASRQGLISEQARLRRELPGIGDGLDESALRQESGELDLDLLPSRIDRETLRQRELLTEIADASAVKQQRKVDLDALMDGRNADLAAAERAAANAEILSIAENWLRRAAAVRLGGLAIERHRSLIQDPLIVAAGSLFSDATNRAFAKLAIDYGTDDQPILVAQRSSGETVPIYGLSEGTRDQLFLSLRLALLTRRPSEPMPFVGDDLLTSFDEERTDATLRLLAAAGQTHQMILFTHHRHVADIGVSIAGHNIERIDL